MAWVRCDNCGRESEVRGALAHGWPVCHGQTMRLMHMGSDEIAADVAAIMAPAQTAISAFRGQSLADAACGRCGFTDCDGSCVK